MNYFSKPKEAIEKKQVTFKKEDSFDVFNKPYEDIVPEQEIKEENQEEKPFYDLLKTTVEGVEVFQSKFMSRQPKFIVDSTKWKTSGASKNLKNQENPEDYKVEQPDGEVIIQAQALQDIIKEEDIHERSNSSLQSRNLGPKFNPKALDSVQRLYVIKKPIECFIKNCRCDHFHPNQPKNLTTSPQKSVPF